MHVIFTGDEDEKYLVFEADSRPSNFQVTSIKSQSRVGRKFQDTIVYKGIVWAIKISRCSFGDPLNVAYLELLASWQNMGRIPYYLPLRLDRYMSSGLQSHQLTEDPLVQ